MKYYIISAKKGKARIEEFRPARNKKQAVKRLKRLGYKAIKVRVY